MDDLLLLLLLTGLQATVALVRAVWAVDCAVAVAAPGDAHGAVLALELIVGATEVWAK